MSMINEIFYHEGKNRPGLYILVTAGLYFALLATNRASAVLDYLKKKSEVQVEDVIGREDPDKFYEINRQRAYLEIDGKPVEDYFKEIKLEKEK